MQKSVIDAANFMRRTQGKITEQVRQIWLQSKMIAKAAQCRKLFAALIYAPPAWKNKFGFCEAQSLRKKSKMALGWKIPKKRAHTILGCRQYHMQNGFKKGSIGQSKQKTKPEGRR